MPRNSTGHPASSRTSTYSLQTLSRPPSLQQQQRPSSVIEHPLPPLRRQATHDSLDSQHETPDSFLPLDVDRYDRIWGDIATRMGDLDTLANKSGTDIGVVSEAHAKSVEQLREAQILLAEAWAGSESRLGSSQSSLLAKLANSAAGIEEAEISDKDRSKMNDQIFQQMEREVGIVMTQLEKVILAQGEVEKVSRDMWKSTLSITQSVEREADRKEKKDVSISS